MPRARAPQQEKPSQREARALQQRVAPTHRNYRKPVHTNEDPMQQNINKYINKFIKKYIFILKIELMKIRGHDNILQK